MAGATLTTIDNILKNDYRDPIIDILNHKTALLSRIEQTSEFTQGKNATIPLNTSRNTGIGARAESGTLPDAGNQGFNTATFNMKYNYGRIQLTGPSIAASRSDAGAFARVLDAEVMGVTRDFADDMNRQLWGDGTGTLAIISSGVASNAAQTIALTGISRTLTAGVLGATKTVLEPASAKLLSAGVKLDILDEDGGDLATTTGQSNNILVSVNRGTGAIVLTTAIATNGAGDTPARLMRAGSETTGTATGTTNAASGVFGEMFGLWAAICDYNPGSTTTSDTGAQTALRYGGVNRAVIGGDYYAGNVLENGAVLRPLSLDLCEQAIDEADIRGNGEPNIIMTSHELNRKMGALLIPDRRYPTADGMTIEMDGGYKALQYDGIPIIKDKHAPDYNMWFIDTTSLVFLKMADLDWMQEDGSILMRVSGTDAYEATLFMYANLGAFDPKNNVRLADLEQ